MYKNVTFCFASQHSFSDLFEAVLVGVIVQVTLVAGKGQVLLITLRMALLLIKVPASLSQGHAEPASTTAKWNRGINSFYFVPLEIDCWLL